MGVFTRSLALLCSFLVALPSGWCCVFDGTPCCDQRQSVEKAQVPTKQKSCCRHKLIEQKHNESNPAPNPSSPAKQCGCEKAPFVPSEVAQHVPDLIATPLAAPVDSSCSKAGHQSEPCRVFDFSSSHLHVSHCVWLC